MLLTIMRGQRTPGWNLLLGLKKDSPIPFFELKIKGIIEDLFGLEKYLQGINNREDI